MTRQLSIQPLDALNQSASSMPPVAPQSVLPSSKKLSFSQIPSLDHTCQPTNNASSSCGREKKDHFVAPPRLIHLDLLIMENSGFPSMAEFEVFLQLYQKSYHHMELAERKKLFQQVEDLRQSMRHPQSIQALLEAQQSIQAGRPFLSLKHYANFSRNGYMLTSMISRCLNLASFTLERAIFKAALEVSKNTGNSNTSTIPGESCEEIVSIIPIFSKEYTNFLFSYPVASNTGPLKIS